MFDIYQNSGSYYNIFTTAHNTSIAGGIFIPPFQNVSMIDSSTAQVRSTDDGRIIFVDALLLGQYNYQEFIGTLDNFIELEGFYLIPRQDNRTLDIVGARDRKHWMKWEPV